MPRYRLGRLQSAHLPRRTERSLARNRNQVNPIVAPCRSRAVAVLFPGRDPNRTTLEGSSEADLVGSGRPTGLWAAVREGTQPGPGGRGSSVNSATGASGRRNGGFMSSLAGPWPGNGFARFPDEVPLLEKLGLENLAGIEKVIEEQGIDCDLRKPGGDRGHVTDAQVADLQGGSKSWPGTGTRQ